MIVSAYVNICAEAPKGCERLVGPIGFARNVYGELTKRSDNAFKPLSVVGDRSSGVLACPECASTSFFAKRSFFGKVALGVLAPKNHVKCVACGTEFLRS
jgi:hypothetical protein